jgi:TolA-binding protein
MQEKNTATNPGFNMTINSRTFAALLILLPLLSIGITWYLTQQPPQKEEEPAQTPKITPANKNQPDDHLAADQNPTEKIQFPSAKPEKRLTSQIDELREQMAEIIAALEDQLALYREQIETTQTETKTLQADFQTIRSELEALRAAQVLQNNPAKPPAATDQPPKNTAETAPTKREVPPPPPRVQAPKQTTDGTGSPVIDIE